jgi:ferredoxin
MNVTVDEGRCCGAGQCVLIAPEVFDLDPEPPAESEAATREAAAVCPAAAIALADGS